jgi:hypothetical protein
METAIIGRISLDGERTSKKRKKKEVNLSEYGKYILKNKTLENIDKMPAKEIVDNVKKITGESIKYSLKSKQSIKKKAIELLDTETKKSQ